MESGRPKGRERVCTRHQTQERSVGRTVGVLIWSGLEDTDTNLQWRIPSGRDWWDTLSTQGVGSGEGSTNNSGDLILEVT